MASRQSSVVYTITKRLTVTSLNFIETAQWLLQRTVSYVRVWKSACVIIIIYPLTARVVGVPQMISQPVSSILHCPLWFGELQACPFPDVVFPPLLCLPCLLPPFTVPCKMGLTRPDERETWPYHRILRLFTMARRSSCGPIACWILPQTSSMVTWSLYEMRSILR